MRRMMMLLGLCVLVVGAVGAVVSSSASAALCTSTPEVEQFRVCLFLSTTELELLEEATFAISQESGEPHKLVVNFGVPLEIECNEASGETGVFVELTMNGKILFTECAVTSPADKNECEVPGSIEAKEIDGTLSLQTELEGATEALRLDLLLAPETAGNAFATFTIKNKPGETCLVAHQSGLVLGEILCFFLEPIETDEVEHLFECPESGSSLNYSGTPAALQAEFSALMTAPVNDASWSITQGL